jgi:hypothetical protein
MEQIELLEAELILMQDNIKRLKDFYLKKKEEIFTQHQSLVVGELKHRAVALKQRLTEIQKINTRIVTK